MIGPKLLFVDPLWGSWLPSSFDRTADLSSVYANPTLNNEGQAAYAATAGIYFGSQDFLVTSPHDGQCKKLGIGIGNPDLTAVAPKIADNGSVVFRHESEDGERCIYALPFDLDTTNQFNGMVAGPENGFTDVGPHPAISDDGSLIVFTGVHSPLGQGLFIADPSNGQYAKVAGHSGDGKLDPGETLIANLDVGPFSEIPLERLTSPNGVDSHLAINRLDSALTRGADRYQISFMADTPGPVSETRTGLYTLEIEPWEIADIVGTGITTYVLKNRADTEDYDALVGGDMYVNYRKVINLGDYCAEVSTTSAVSEISMYDALSTHGELTFHAKLLDDTQAIVVAGYTPLDLDVDSNNSGGAPDHEDDRIEANPNLPGLVIPANWGDLDEDEIADYADLHINPASGPEADKARDLFGEMILTVPDTMVIDWDNALFQFDYNASEPTWLDSWARPSEGALRIWNKRADEERSRASISSSGGSYVAPNVPYAASDLGLNASNKSIKLFIEGIFRDDADGSVTSERIEVSVDPDGSNGPATYIGADAVIVSEPQNYAGIFMGGVRLDGNFPRYYNNLKETHNTLITQKGVPAKSIFILYADGRDGSEDLNLTGRWPRRNTPVAQADRDNSEMAFAGTSYVASATRDNLVSVMDHLETRVTKHDHFLFYTYDHGSGWDTDSFYNANLPLNDANGDSVVTLAEAGPAVTAALNAAYVAARADHRDESLCAWNSPDITDTQLRTELQKVKGGYNSYVFSQCFSGGMLEEFFTTVPGPGNRGQGSYRWNAQGSKYFGMSAATHFETSKAGHPDGFAGAFVDAIKNENETHKIFAHAKDHDEHACSAGSDNEGAWDPTQFFFYSPPTANPLNWQLVNNWEHPWCAGDSFSMFYSSPADQGWFGWPLLFEAPAIAPDAGNAESTGRDAPILDDVESAFSVSRILSRFNADGSTAVPQAWTNITLEITDLPNNLLGQASGNTITLDSDAAGYGWFIDTTPWEDTEFDPQYAANHDGQLSPAEGRVDLLTVVLHEMGHLLGLEHAEDEDDFMHETLSLGTRRTTTSQLADAVFGTEDDEETELDDELIELLADRDWYTLL